MAKAKTKQVIDFKPMTFTVNVATRMNVKHIAMCGWQPNYADFEHGEVKGTITFTGETLNVSINNEHAVRFKVEDLVEFALLQVKNRVK